MIRCRSRGIGAVYVALKIAVLALAVYFALRFMGFL